MINVVNNSIFLDRCKSLICFKLVFNQEQFLDFKYKNKNEYFQYFWSKYQDYKKDYKLKNNKEINNTYNGQSFSIIIINLINRENIQIEAMDEIILDLPFVKPDVIIKSKKGNNIFLSLKTSLRERWKQADWESIKYKKKFKNANCFLLSNNYKEVSFLKTKIDNLDIDKVFHTNEKDFDELFDELK